MLSIFVIVVCIGYWGIYPVVKGIVNTNKEIATQKETQEENELKLTQVPMMEADNERFSNEIQGVRESFFPMMESAEIDKYFTELVLGYNLSAYDLAIQMPQEETALEPYVYSKRAAMLAAQEKRIRLKHHKARKRNALKSKRLRRVAVCRRTAK